jgi:Flp pilus assembly protein TadD
LPTTPRRSSSIPTIPTSTSIAVRPTTTRASSIRLDKEDARAYYNRGLARSNKGDFERAIADFDQAIKLAPRDAEAYAGRANAYEELGNDVAAKADYKRALQLDPDNEDAKEGVERLKD